MGWGAGFTANHLPLDVDCTTDRLLRRGELDEHAVACGLDDAPAPLVDLGIDQLTAMKLLAAEHTFLVLLHEPAVACHVGGYDGSELTLHEGTVRQILQRLVAVSMTTTRQLDQGVYRPRA